MRRKKRETLLLCIIVLKEEHKPKHMLVKDLKGKNLGGVKVRTPNGVEGYWASQWMRGVWLSNSPTLSGAMTPVFVKTLDECLEWEVIEEITN